MNEQTRQEIIEWLRTRNKDFVGESIQADVLKGIELILRVLLEKQNL